MKLSLVKVVHYPGLEVSPKSRDRRVGMWHTRRHRERPLEGRQREGCSHKPRTPAATGSWQGEAGSIVPWRWPEGPTPGLGTCGLQNREMVHMCCFKPPSLWQFVVAAPGNSQCTLLSAHYKEGVRLVPVTCSPVSGRAHVTDSAQPDSKTCTLHESSYPSQIPKLGTCPSNGGAWEQDILQENVFPRTW